MSEEERRRPGRQKDEQLTERVIGAALQLLGEQAWSDVTIEAIARRAGVSRPSIYSRWGTLPDLLLDATLTARRRAPGYSDGGPVAAPNTGSLRGDLGALVEQGIATFDALEAANVLQGLVSDAMRYGHIAERVGREVLDRDEEQYRVIFERAVDRGELEAMPEIPEVVPQLLFGFFLHRRVLRRDPPTAAEVDYLVEVITQGLAARATEPRGRPAG